MRSTKDVVGAGVEVKIGGIESTANTASHESTIGVVGRKIITGVDHMKVTMKENHPAADIIVIKMAALTGSRRASEKRSIDVEGTMKRGVETTGILTMTTETERRVATIVTDETEIGIIIGTITIEKEVEVIDGN